jgi:hypothetical protein
MASGLSGRRRPPFFSCPAIFPSTRGEILVTRVRRMKGDGEVVFGGGIQQRGKPPFPAA